MRESGCNGDIVETEKKHVRRERKAETRGEVGLIRD